MTVIEIFASMLAEQGIPADASTLADPDTINAALDRIDAWFWDLDPAVREGYDEATGEEAICRMIADLGVAVDISGLLEAFDASVGGLTLSELVPIARESLRTAIDTQEGVG